MRNSIKFIAVECFFVLLAGVASAQIQVGFRGGVNAATVSTPTVLAAVLPTFDPTFSPTGGVFVDIPLNDRVIFRPEVDFVQKGFSIYEGTTLNIAGFSVPVGARVAFQSQTVQVPLLLKLNLTGAGSIQPYLIAGPALSYAVNDRIRTRATALFTTQPMDVNVNPGTMLNRWDASAIGGLGLTVPVGRGSVFGEARYEFGLTRQIQVPVINVDVRNRGVSLALGYSLPFGR